MARPDEEIAEVSGSLGQASFGAVQIQTDRLRNRRLALTECGFLMMPKSSEWPGSAPSWTGEVSLSSLGYFIPSPLISTNANNRQGELDLYFGVN